MQYSDMDSIVNIGGVRLKKYIMALIGLMLLVTVVGCAKENADETIVLERHSLEEFQSMFTGFAEKENINVSLEELNAFRDITPENVFNETGGQIFKNGTTCESYLVYDGKIYTLGIGFGGLGLVDVTTSDFDGNGQKELIYTYSWGSGIHRSCFGCFDLSKKAEIEVDISYILYCSTNYISPNNFVF